MNYIASIILLFIAALIVSFIFGYMAGYDSQKSSDPLAKEEDYERETKGSQPAPVLRPDCVAGTEHVYIVYSYDAESIHMECSECRDVWHVNVR
jgi:hypothetical protein